MSEDDLKHLPPTTRRGHWARCPDCFRALEVRKNNTCRITDCWMIDWMKANYGADETL